MITDSQDRAGAKFGLIIGRKIAELVEAGFTFPIYAISCDSSGHMVAMRYDTNETNCLIPTHLGEIGGNEPNSPVVSPPLSIFFRDPTGQSAELQFEPPPATSRPNEERN